MYIFTSYFWLLIDLVCHNSNIYLIIMTYVMILSFNLIIMTSYVVFMTYF